MFTCKHNRVFRCDREPSRIPEATLKRLGRKCRKLKEFGCERIRPSIPESSCLPRYVKVRRVTKSVCKLNTKRVTLNKANGIGWNIISLKSRRDRTRHSTKCFLR